MLLNRNQIFKMVLSSLWRSPKDWEVDSHEKKVMPWTSIYWITNEKLDINIWAANGLPYFKLQKSENESFLGRLYGKKIKLNIFQTTLLHIAYLRKIRKYPYLLILIRYFFVGAISLFFVNILVFYLENFSSEKEMVLNLSKIEYRNDIIDKILK